jgi:hypothetical protein
MKTEEIGFLLQALCYRFPISKETAAALIEQMVALVLREDAGKE